LGERTRTLLDFAAASAIELWAPIDDLVMGGLSRSRFTAGDPGSARFSGMVSLENGGGFASVRTRPRSWPTAGTDGFALRVRGDGKTYKFTVRVDDRFDGIQYQARFSPPAGEWTEVVLPAVSFLASFRGRPVSAAPPLEMRQVRALGLMISERQAGAFELLISRIAATADRAG